MNRLLAVTATCIPIAFALWDHSNSAPSDTRPAPLRRVVVPPGPLSGHLRWTADAVYTLTGVVTLADGATLDVEAGTRIEGVVGSRIVVPRTSRISAVGTLLQPIVFTCEGGASYSGCWGGMVVHGHAPINSGLNTSPAARGTGQSGCKESMDTDVGVFYGGCDPADSSGALRYVRIEYAEFDGLRLAGVGSRTLLDNIQLNRGLSKGMSVIGGTANLMRVVFTANGSTSLSWTAGWTGRAQFLLMQLDLARGLSAVSGILGDNGGVDNLPRSAPTLYNVSILGILPPPVGVLPPAVLFKNGTSGTLRNVLMFKMPVGLSVQGASTCAQIGATSLTLSNSVLVGTTAIGDPDADPVPCAGFSSPDVESQWLQAPGNGNEIIATPAQVAALLKGPGELITLDGRPTVTLTGGTNPPTDGFFDANASYVGALNSIEGPGGVGAIPWHSGWTAPAPVPPPTPVGSLVGVVASMRLGPLTGVSVAAVGTGIQSVSAPDGAFALSALPAGPASLIGSGLPAQCSVPASIESWVPVGATGQVAVLAACGVSGAFVDVGAGGNHTCAITSAGIGRCWGANDVGQVGDGTTGNVRSSPTPLAGDPILAGVLAGEVSQSCGLTASGAAMCWGALSRQFAAQVFTPVAFRGLALGANHACGLSVVGASYCWGANNVGQFGNGGFASTDTPVATSGGHVFAQIAAGLTHTCALAVDQSAWCWGLNSIGQVGDGTSANVRADPVPVADGHLFISITAGGDHACGLKANGEVWCWGSNSWGQLGNGIAGSPESVPVRVVGGAGSSAPVEETVSTLVPLAPAPPFARIEAGQNHTCGTTAAGTLFCWGANFGGQLGDGTTTRRTTPTAVQGGLAFAVISAGGQHTCGVTIGGALYCWGWNGSGQIGNDTTSTGVLTPTLIPPA